MLKPFILAASLLTPIAAEAATVTHFPPPPRPGGAAMGGTSAEAAKRVLDSIQRTVEAGGLTMDDLVWVQVFSSDLEDYAVFNEVYRTYFKGPLPARAYIGTSQLLGGARFEVMGIAVKPTSD